MVRKILHCVYGRITFPLQLHYVFLTKGTPSSSCQLLLRLLHRENRELSDCTEIQFRPFCSSSGVTLNEKIGDQGMAAKGLGSPEFETGIAGHIPRDDIKLPQPQPGTPPAAHPDEVLRELGVLLDEYAPTWYTGELRHGVVTALRLPIDSLVELCALLEDYGPTWYTARQRGRALRALEALGLLETDAL
jgi:hypothetical protein